MKQDFYKKYIAGIMTLIACCLLSIFILLKFRGGQWIVCALFLATAVFLTIYTCILWQNIKSFRETISSELADEEILVELEKVCRKVFIPSCYHIILLLKKDMEQKYNKLLLNREAKLEVLQSQINPHFLYNTLDAIRSDIREAGLEKPAEMLEELATFFRYSISEKEIIISLKEELKNVDTYMNIMRYRFGGRLELVKYVDIRDDKLMNFQMPKMLLQPLIENSINHGLESRMGEGLIVMHIDQTDQYIEIIIQDNGIGINQEKLERLRKMLAGENGGSREKSDGGLALGNVNRRLKLYFGEPYGLSITSMEGIGTEIHILMPVEGGTIYGSSD